MQQSLKDILRTIEVNELKYLGMLNDNMTAWILERDYIKDQLDRVSNNTLVKQREILENRYNMLTKYMSEAKQRINELETRVSWINKFDLTPYEQ